MPMMILSMVVLPAPLGPTSAKRSPGLIWKDAPLKRTRAPKLFSILSTRRIMVPPLTLCAYMKKGPNLRWSLIQCSGGDEGDRTPDLLTASQALSQLSYAPVTGSYYRGSLSLMQEVFWVDSRTYGFSWDGAKIITLRAIIFIRRPDKTLMEQIRYCNSRVDVNRCYRPDDVADAGVG